MRFRVAGVPVRVQPFFFAMAALLGLAGISDPALIAAWVAVVFTGVLAHELGHAAAFRSFGCDCAIELHGFGGHTSSRNAGGLTTWQDIAVSVAGPAVGIAIGGAAELALDSLDRGSIAYWVVYQVSWVNLGWGLLNLVPMLPLDGGRVLIAALRRLLPGSGERAAYGVSTAVAALGLLAAIRYEQIWPALLCGMFGWSNLQQMRALAAVGPDRALFEELRRGFDAVGSGDSARAAELARSVAARAQRDATRLEAHRLLAWAQLHSDDPPAAQDTLARLPQLGEHDPLLHGLALRAAGRAREAIGPLSRALDSERSEVAGAALVASLAEAGDLDGAERLIQSPQAAVLDQASLARLGELLLQRARPAVALLAAERWFGKGRSGPAALTAARASAAVGDDEGAMAWLRRALDAGLPDPRRALDAPELAGLSGRSDFEALRRR